MSATEIILLMALPSSPAFNSKTAVVPASFPSDFQRPFPNSLDAWKVEALGAGTENVKSVNNAETFVAEGDDDLPF